MLVLFVDQDKELPDRIPAAKPFEVLEQRLPDPPSLIFRLDPQVIEQDLGQVRLVLGKLVGGQPAHNFTFRKGRQNDT